MRKVYLLITSALLLLGSSTLWAEVLQSAEGAVASLTVPETTTYYSTIAEAMTAWQSSGGTLTLLDNCEYTTSGIFYLPKTSGNQIEAELDLNGKKLTYSTSYMLGYGIYVRSGAVLTIKDGSSQAGNGKLSLVMSRKNTKLYGMYITGGVVNINGGSFEASVATAGKEADVCYLATTANSELNINAGIFENNVISNNSNFLITGGKFKNAANNQYDSFDKYTAPNTYLSLGLDDYYTLTEIPDEDVVATVDGVKYRKFDLACERSSEEYNAILQKDIVPTNYISSSAYINLNNHNITFDNVIFSINGKTVSLVGNGIITSTTNGGVFELYGNTIDEPNYSVLTIGNNVIVNAPNGWTSTIYSKNYGTTGQDKAFGVVLNVNGTINSKNGITINGSVNQLSGNVPVININDGASVTCSNEDACIYAAGYGIWNIGKATLDAGTIIYAKSGQINIDGAQMTSHASVSTATPNCNGWDTTGDAIVMDTNDCYPGAVQLNITGNAKVLSDNGYAVREIVTKSNASTAIGLVINGDETYLEGGSGAVQLTDYFKDALKDGSSKTYQWVLNGVSGGLYTTVPPVVADGYVVEETTISGDTYYKVVPAPASPVAPASQTLYIVNDTKFDYAMDLTNSSAIVVKSGYTLEIKGLTINRTDDADASKVTVESGAKLIVGSEGIQTNNAEGLELLSGENGMGMLLYDGSTTATSPLGTANLYVYSKNLEGGDRIWQHFGIPTQATPAITKAVPASFNNWDVKKGWVWDGGSATLTAPWVGHNLSVNSDEPGQIIKFAGQLVGKEDATLTLDKYGYNAFANSYTAPVNLKSIIDGALAIDACTDGAVWVYSAAKAISTGIAKFDSYGADTSEKDSLASMQAFFILHESNSADNIELSYNEAVLGQNTRGADASSYNKATFTVTANGEADDFKIYEGEQFSSTSIDRGYDIKQMNHGFIKIFAKQNGEDYASVATDDAEGVELYIETKQAGEYKLSFSNISEGYEISLTDIVTGTEVEVAEDKVYTFTVDENTTVKRFRFGKSQVSTEEANADAVKIWANDGAIFVANNAAEANIEIINLSGVVVATAAANGEAVQAVPVAGLASGVYVVRVGTATAKVVK